jgi:pimeloyl-ACP methyl ester carboxylesterase
VAACGATLARDFTVVTDLRGYGASGVCDSRADHAPYAMRALAADQVVVMGRLGYDRFAVAGHDRGARCAYRMALDHPQAVTALAVLDIVPTAEAFARADQRFAAGFWVWSFLAAPAPVPETLIGAAPEVFVDHLVDTWAQRPDAFPPAIRDAYCDQFRDPPRVHAICEQYRAAPTLDGEHPLPRYERNAQQRPLEGVDHRQVPPADFRDSTEDRVSDMAHVPPRHLDRPVRATRPPVADAAPLPGTNVTAGAGRRRTAQSCTVAR